MPYRAYVFASNRIEFIQRLIIADDKTERTSALSKLEKMQKSDFKEIFSIMGDREVTIRLLDPPLHEFLPDNQSTIEKIAKSLNKSVESVKNKIVQLSEKTQCLATGAAGSPFLILKYIACKPGQYSVPWMS